MPISEYAKPDQPAHERDAADTLDQLAALAETARVELPPIAAGRELVARSRRYVEQGRAATEDKGKASQRIARELVAGTLDFDGAVTEAARVEAMQSGGILHRAVTLTEALAARQAFAQTGRDLDGDQVLEHCRASVADTLEEIRGLRDTLDGINDGDEAAEAGPKIAKAWSTYRAELLPRFAAAHDLVKRLRELYWIDPLPIAPFNLNHHATYGRVDLARSDNQHAKRRGAKPIRHLLDVCCDAWEPGGPYTEAEAHAFDRAIRGELGEQDAAHAEVAERDPIAAEAKRRERERTGRAMIV